MQALEIPEWSDTKWVAAVRHQVRNWPAAVAQRMASIETARPEIRLLRGVCRTAGWPHPVEVKLRSGTILRTTDPWHLAGLLEAGWRVTPEGELLRLEGPEGVQLLVRPTDRESLDLCSLFETFVRGDYGDRFPEWDVLDLGGGNGDSALCFASRGARKVIAVEPDPRSLERMRRNLALNPSLSGIVPLEAAVTPNGAPIDLPLTSRYAAGSGAGGVVSLPPIVRARGVALEDLLSEFDRVDLLKIDIEGGEYEILSGLPAEGWPKIRAVRMEFHRGLQRLPALLEAHGFSVRASLGVEQGLLYAERSS